MARVAHYGGRAPRHARLQLVDARCGRIEHPLQAGDAHLCGKELVGKLLSIVSGAIANGGELRHGVVDDSCAALQFSSCFSLPALHSGPEQARERQLCASRQRIGAKVVSVRQPQCLRDALTPAGTRRNWRKIKADVALRGTHESASLAGASSASACSRSPTLDRMSFHRSAGAFQGTMMACG